MQRAFKAAFAKNPAAVVIIGSDIPGISVDIIQQAFEALQSNDLALGPAQDGGYYLIGIKSTLPAETYGRLFGGIDWGTDQVLAQTLKIADGLKLRSTLLQYLVDVDRPDDLPTWYQAQKKVARMSLPKISIIIPTLNEAAVIERTLSRLQDVEHLEVMVVDGGSTDETLDLAESMGVQVLQTPPGKAAQMNRGARKATGEVLVFLHADTVMPGGFDHLILNALNQKGVVAGAFRLAIESRAAGIRFIERMTDLRSCILGLPYGDQALFMKKSIFEDVGGYADLSIMEDFVLVRRLRRKGKIAILPDKVITSPRRWLHFGILKTWLVNQAIVIAFYLGVAPERLARWYRREAGKKTN
jgi:rSAM/selenodomain-associated transferase 2